jgi:hypothetical protein
MKSLKYQRIVNNHSGLIQISATGGTDLLLRQHLLARNVVMTAREDFDLGKSLLILDTTGPFSYTFDKFLQYLQCA